MPGGRFPGRVQERRVLGGCVWLSVEVPEWPGAEPGQFALLQAEPSACFLGRPLSVAWEEGSTVSFLIAPVGAGTRELSHLSPGDDLWVLGPLGRGFSAATLIGPAGGRLLLVGGGVGVAPLPLVLKSLASEGADRGAAVLVLLGFRDAVQAEAAAPTVEAVARLHAAGIPSRCIITTEDGSVGTAGLVTGALSAELRSGDRVAVCGPWAMAEAVWRVCSEVEGVSSWYSLETGMACGVGSCHGCVIALADGSLVRVCTEGPVFAGEDVWARPSLRREGEGATA